jgi:GNAT superfamily N-acetyltransferase
VRVLLRGWHRIRRALYSRQAQYIMVTHTDTPDAFSGSGETDEIECVVVESPAALDRVPCIIPAGIPRDTLRLRLQAGCIVILACASPPGGAGATCVGYSVLERGVFSALGRRREVSRDVLFAHHAEVLPAYRGRRIYPAMMRAQLAYGRRHGMRRVCAVVSDDNRASLRSTSRVATIRGVVARVDLFRGLIVLETPWPRITRALGESERGWSGHRISASRSPGESPGD